MLSNLEKPYRYDSNCIYWDFYHAKWRYFQRPAPISIMPQERNKMEDNLFHTDLIEDVISVSERYLEDDVYVVRHLEEDYSDQKGFTIFSPPSRKTEFTLEPYRDKPSRIKKLKYGDLIKFVKNTK